MFSHLFHNKKIILKQQQLIQSLDNFTKKNNFFKENLHIFILVYLVFFCCFRLNKHKY